ncbi:T9SS type A sorting domain-containing protein [Hymenobacter aerilatus]|uniref:T9SS type A sorting domain-containing protein n=1 Tax=Hymenobacter aerilatus TaxID=2932251 RepID=A0A8T9SVN6_9BACT|nr:T9SS type A sorting domain-containing protein [Hymenobacter aerilatus]UOR05817.1 T9SS type A sorting domain-containing protein [Hymenobacter aerilatus]
MKHLYLTRKVFSALFLLVLAVGSAKAQFRTVNVNGSADATEYGNENTQETDVSDRPNMTWYMTWDDTNLYIAISDVNNDVNKREATVIYLDTNPIIPVNGGSSSDGSNKAFNNYDGTSGILPFRADIALFLRKNYKEYRKPDGGNGWNNPVSDNNTGNTRTGITVVYNNESTNGTREISIPWSIMGGRPASFNMVGYVTAPTLNGGYIYGQIPAKTVLNRNGAGPIGTDAKFVRYYTVSSTNNGAVNSTEAGATGPFSRESYATPDQNNSNFGQISVYDFTANHPFINNSLQLNRTSSGTPTWNISNNLYIGKDVSVYANTQAPINVGGKFTVADGGKFYQEAAPLRITGDFTINDFGTFAPGSAATSAVVLDGDETQVVRAKNLTLANLSLTGGDKTLTSNLTINNNITLSAGARLVTGNNSLILTGNTVNAPGAQLNEVLDAAADEAGGGYVLGTVESTEQIGISDRDYNFNNIGLTIRANGTTAPTLPGQVTVQRLTGLIVTAQEPGNPTSISRQYRIVAGNQNNVDVDLTFGYRDKQNNELRTIPEAQLTLFRSPAFNQGPYQRIGGAVNATANTVFARTAVNLSGVFTLGDGNNPLPVELVAFTGKLEGSAVRLNWATASEKNNKGFEVQRNTGGDQWFTLGFVAGHGSTSQRNAYSFRDANAPEGKATYRLRQLDNDGTESFSPVVTIEVPAGNAPALVLSPVPTPDVLTISGLGSGAHVAEVYDMMGKRVLSHSFKDQTTTVSVANLPSGLYVVQVQGKKSKFVKQ